jgi:hypothetical protein
MGTSTYVRMQLLPDESRLLEVCWKFDSSIFELRMGIPRWLTSAACMAQNRYYGVIKNYLDTKDETTAIGADAGDLYAGIIVIELVGWVKESAFEEGVAVCR